MAVAGSSIPTYTYALRNGVVRIIASGHKQRGVCLAPDDAVRAVLAGEAATVAGCDAWAMRDLLAAAGKAVQP